MISLADGDVLGRMVMALGLMAMVAYLLPAVMSLSPQSARRTQIAAIALLTAALIAAVVASIVWFAR